MDPYSLFPIGKSVISVSILPILKGNDSYYLLERQHNSRRKWGTKLEMFNLVVLSSNGCSVWDRAMHQPDAWNLTHVGARIPDTWSIFRCFPRCLSEELEHNQGLSWHSDGGCWCHRWGRGWTQPQPFWYWIPRPIVGI